MAERMAEKIEGHTILHLIKVANDNVKKKTTGSTVLDPEAEARIPKFDSDGTLAESCCFLVSTIASAAFIFIVIWILLLTSYTLSFPILKKKRTQAGKGSRPWWLLCCHGNCQNYPQVGVVSRE